MHRFLKNYLERHQHPVNQLLHAIGLPVTFVLPVVLLVEGAWWGWALLSFAVGYAFQFAGHAVEGNDAGEVILVKKACGRPYVDIVRRANQSSSEGRNDDSPHT